MQLMKEIPGSFWSLFRSVNRETYIEALLQINEEYQYNNYFLSWDVCVQVLNLSLIHILEKLLGPSCRDQAAMALIRYLAKEDREEKLLENPQVMKTPIVRNGKQATVGYQPEIWKTWT